MGKLTADPDDVSAREQLAQVFAEGLGRYDLGIDQLELLLELPNARDDQRPVWLSQVASWQFKMAGDGEAGRETLRRLIEKYPASVHAFAAQRRLLLLENERRIRRAQMATR